MNLAISQQFYTVLSTVQDVQTFSRTLQAWVQHGAQFQVCYQYVLPVGTTLPNMTRSSSAPTAISNNNNQATRPVIQQLQQPQLAQQQQPPIPQQYVQPIPCQLQQPQLPSQPQAQAQAQPHAQHQHRRGIKDKFKVWLPAIDEHEAMKLLNPNAHQFQPSSPSSSASPPSWTSSDTDSDSDSMTDASPTRYVVRGKRVYDPEPFNNLPARARLNIFIDESITEQWLPLIDRRFETTKELYYYLDMSTTLQINDRQMHEFDLDDGSKVMFANYDICHKGTTEPLYAVIRPNKNKSKRQNSSSSSNKHSKRDENRAEVQKKKWLWELKTFLTADQILNAYDKLNKCDLPTSSRRRHQFASQLDEKMYRDSLAAQAHILERADWTNIQKIQIKLKADKQDSARSGPTNKNKKRGRNVDGSGMQHTLQGSKSEFVACCKAAWQTAPMVPMAVTGNKNKIKSHWIEWLKLIPVDGCHIGVSCQFNVNLNQWMVRSICMDKGDVINKLRLCGLDARTEKHYIGRLRCFNRKYFTVNLKSC